MSFDYKNPTSSTIVFGPISVTRENDTGTNFSVDSIGGYMEVFNLSDLDWTIPVGTLGQVLYSGNSLPISFNYNTPFSTPNQLNINNDLISSGRRRLGMLVYVYETDLVYQYYIPNYDTLWNNAETAGSITDIGSGFIVQNDTVPGSILIDSWTASTIEGVSGVTRPNARWRIYSTSGGTNVSTGDTYVTGFTLSSNTITLSQNRADQYSAFTINLSGLTGSSGSSINIYNSDGTLTGNRVMNMSSYTLTLSGKTNIIYSPTAFTDSPLVIKNTDPSAFVSNVISFDCDATGIDQPVFMNFASTNPKGFGFYASSNPITTTPDGAAFQMFNISATTFPGQVFFDSGAHDNAAIIWRTAPTLGTITERMRVTSDGKVGIGTSTPQYTLDVNGAGYINGDLTISSPNYLNLSYVKLGGSVNAFGLDYANFSATSNNTGVAITATAKGNPAGYGYAFQFKANQNANQLLFVGDNTTKGHYIHTDAAPGGEGWPLVFGVATAGQNWNTNSNLLVLTSGQTVGIGTKSPTNKLHLSASTDPLKVEGLSADTSLKLLNIDSNGVVHTNDISTGLTINGPISATTYYGDGSNLSNISRGGGGGTVFFINQSVSQGSYKEFSTTATTTGEVIISATTGSSQTALIGSYQTPLGVPGTTLIPAGYWTFYLHTYNDNGNAKWDLFCELYKITTGGTETLILTTDAVTVTNTTTQMSITDGFLTATTLNSSDRLIVRVKATNLTNQSHIIYFLTEGSQHYSYGISTFPLNVLTFSNGLTLSENNVTLGGSLTATTTLITLGTNTLNFSASTGNTLVINNGYINIGPDPVRIGSSGGDRFIRGTSGNGVLLGIDSTNFGQFGTNFSYSNRIRLNNSGNNSVRIDLNESQTLPIGSSVGAEIAFQPQVNHLDSSHVIRGYDWSGNSGVKGNIYLYASKNLTNNTYGDIILQYDGTSSRGNVGIGTSSPAYKLDVNGGAYQQKYYTDTGSASFRMGSGYELYNIPHSGGGYEYYFTNNFGLGSGWIFNFGDNTNKVLQVSSGDIKANKLVYLYSGFNLYNGTLTSFQSSPDVGLQYYDSGSWNFVISGYSGNKYFTINNSGNVGIRTSSPSHSLEVSGTVRTTNNTRLANESGNVLIGPTPTSGSYSGGTIPSTLTINSGGGGGISFLRPTDFAQMYAMSVPDGTTLKIGGGNQNFIDIYGHTTFIARFSNSGSGMLGVGTSSPSNTLHVSASTDPVKFIGVQTSTDTDLLTIDTTGVVHKISSSGLTASAATIYNSDGALSGNRLVNIGTNSLRFSSSTQPNLFVLDGSNQVGIGTNSPLYKFEVANTGNTNVIRASQNTNITDINTYNAILGINNQNLTLNTYALLSFQHGSGVNATGVARIGSRLISTTGGVGNYSGDMTFQVNNGTSFIEGIYIKNNANVGFGLTTPSAKVHAKNTGSTTSDVSIFSDNFNRASVSPGGTPSVSYSTIGTSSIGSINLNTNALRLTQSNIMNVVYSTYPSFPTNSYKTQLNANLGTLQWAVNTRQSYNATLTGFGAGQLGSAIVLACSGPNPYSTGVNGYALVFGNLGTNQWSLSYFTNGLNSNGNITNIITSPIITSDTRCYYSLRVTYNTTNNIWSLYNRIDGCDTNTIWNDPLTTSTLIGSATDSTYVGVPLPNFAFMYNSISGNCGFDNFSLINLGTTQYPDSVRVDDGNFRQTNGFSLFENLSTLNFTNDYDAALNSIPLYGLYRNGNNVKIRTSNSSAETNVSYVNYMFSHGSINPGDAQTYYIGMISDLEPTVTDVASRRVICQYNGRIEQVSIMSAVGGTLSTTEASTIVIYNVTQSTGVTINTGYTYNIADNNINYTLSTPLPVNAGDSIQIRWTTPTWVTNPTAVRQYFNAKIRLI